MLQKVRERDFQIKYSARMEDIARAHNQICSVHREILCVYNPVDVIFYPNNESSYRRRKYARQQNGVGGQFCQRILCIHILRTNCDTHSHSMEYNDDIDDDIGVNSVTSSTHYQPYSFTTIYAARKFLRAVRRSSIPEVVQASLLSSQVRSGRSVPEEGGNAPLISTPPALSRSSSHASRSNNIPHPPTLSSLRHGVLSQPSHESRKRSLKSPHQFRQGYLSMHDGDDKSKADIVEFEVPEGKPPTLRGDFIELKKVITNSWIYLFILLIPVAVLSKYLQWKDLFTFVSSAIAVIPLVSTHIYSPIEYSTCPFPNSPSLADSIVRTGEFVGRIHRRGGLPFKPMCRRPNKCIIWKCCGSHCSSAGSKS